MVYELRMSCSSRCFFLCVFRWVKYQRKMFRSLVHFNWYKWIYWINSLFLLFLFGFLKVCVPHVGISRIQHTRKHSLTCTHRNWLKNRCLRWEIMNFSFREKKWNEILHHKMELFTENDVVCTCIKLLGLLPWAINTNWEYSLSLVYWEETKYV